MTLTGNGENSMKDVEGNAAKKNSLTDGEKKGIMITAGDVDVSVKQGDNCLARRYWSKKKYNKEAFKTVLSRLWRAVGRVTFRELYDNLWLF